MSISQLDLLLLGRRGLTQRIGSVEQQIRDLTIAGGVSFSEDTSSLVRPNLLINSSFEYYDRGSTLPQAWTTTGSLNIGASGADGAVTVRLDTGETISQDAAESVNLQQCAVVVSVNARTTSSGQKVTINLTHTPGVTNGTTFRLGTDGQAVQTDELPADGKWYRFYRAFILTGGGPATVSFTAAGSSGQIELDAAKFEKEDGSSSFLEPTAYIAADWGAASHIRNLAADNIIAGTLTVGGSGSSNPRISVVDDADIEIVTIGDPTNGFYGIDVKQGAGIRVQDDGTIEIEDAGEINVTGTGGVNVSGGGSVNVSSGGDVNVSGGGSVNVTDGGGVNVSGGAVAVTSTGVIRAGTAGAQRVELTVDGLYGYNASNQQQVHLSSATGKLTITGAGSVVVSGGGSILAGTEGGARLEIASGGIYSYNSDNEETVSISATDGILRVDADAFLVSGTVTFDSLVITGALTLGQDFAVGANVLFVDQSQSNVGINRAPDPQFDLDINGSMRAGGFIVGKHALQIADAVFIAHFDGKPPIDTDTTGDLRGHLGQAAITTGSVLHKPGKFNKGVELQSGATLRYSATGVFTVGAASGALAVWVKFSDTTGTQTLLYVPDAEGSPLLKVFLSSTLQVTLKGTTVDSSVPVSTGEWYHLAVSWDSGEVTLYVNGEEVASGSYPDSLAFGSSFYVGSLDTSERTLGVLDDLIILSRAFEDGEVLAIYESDAPVFAETSEWGFRTPNTLAWADSEGLWATDASGNAAFGVSGVNNKSWGNLGSTRLDAGDVLIGNSTQYILWDASAGSLIIKGEGSGVTNINGGNIQAGTITANKLSVSALSAISANLGTVTAGTITGATLQTAASGARVVIDSSNGLRSFNSSGTQQVQIRTSDGAMTAGAGKLRLDASGISFDNVTTYNITNSIKWITTGGTTFAEIYAIDGAGWQEVLATAGVSSTKRGVVALTAVGLDGTNAEGAGLLLEGSSSSGAIKSRTIITGHTTTITGGLTVGDSFYSPTQGLKVGNPSYSPLFGELSTQGAIVAGGAIYPGGQTSYYFFYTTNVTGSGNPGIETGGYLGAQSVVAQNWFRSNGNSGWINQTYGGGIVMTDSTYVQIYGGKSFYVPGGLWVGGSASGIGTAPAVGYRLSIHGPGTTSATHALVVRNATPSDLMRLRDDGYSWVAIDWDVGSDERLKKDIKPVVEATERARRLRPVSYKQRMEGNNNTYLGLVAQEVRDVLPEVVGEDEKGFLSIRYQGIGILTLRYAQEIDERLRRVEEMLYGE